MEPLVPSELGTFLLLRSCPSDAMPEALAVSLAAIKADCKDGISRPLTQSVPTWERMEKLEVTRVQVREPLAAEKEGQEGIPRM